MGCSSDQEEVLDVRSIVNFKMLEAEYAVLAIAELAKQLARGNHKLSFRQLCAATLGTHRGSHKLLFLT